MNLFIGVKMVNAVPMTRLEYIALRGWELPANENGEDEGFLVEYVDGGKPNHADFLGYVSWSPKEVFDKAYSKVDGMPFGTALEALKAGHKVARRGWNGKGMYLSLQSGSTITAEQARGGVAKALAEEGFTEIVIGAHIDMKAADGTVVVGWLASQTDMLSNDWTIVI